MRWISVKDKPPPISACVWTARNEIMYAEMMRYEMDGGWEWYNGSKIQVLEPTHWMLPEPPSEQS